MRVGGVPTTEVTVIDFFLTLHFVFWDFKLFEKKGSSDGIFRFEFPDFTDSIFLGSGTET
jgi:hypothetical protein